VPCIQEYIKKRALSPEKNIKKRAMTLENIKKGSCLQENIKKSAESQGKYCK